MIAAQTGPSELPIGIESLLRIADTTKTPENAQRANAITAGTPIIQGALRPPQAVKAIAVARAAKTPNKPPAK